MSSAASTVHSFCICGKWLVLQLTQPRKSNFVGKDSLALSPRADGVDNGGAGDHGALNIPVMM